jgi:hypothetical protein
MNWYMHGLKARIAAILLYILIILLTLLIWSRLSMPIVYRPDLIARNLLSNFF